MGRSANYNDVEISTFLKVFKKYRNVIQCKRTDSKTLFHKKKAWERIAKAFNAATILDPRTEIQLKFLWKNLKQKAKRNGVFLRRECPSTVRGVSNAPSTSDRNLELVQSLIAEQIHPVLSTPYDDDRSLKFNGGVNVQQTTTIDVDSMEETTLDFVVEDKPAITRVPNSTARESHLMPHLPFDNEREVKPNLPRIPAADALRNSATAEDSASLISSANRTRFTVQDVNSSKMELLRFEWEARKLEHDFKMGVLRSKKLQMEEEHLMKMQILRLEKLKAENELHIS